MALLVIPRTVGLIKFAVLSASHRQLTDWLAASGLGSRPDIRWTLQKGNNSALSAIVASVFN